MQDKKINTVNRLNGRLPKIGIRPTIDGRRNGVREALEEKTMCLANAVAELITSNLRHSNGSLVECVIADTTIGGAAEAARCFEKFEIEGVGAVITVTPSWCYASEVIDINSVMPSAIWGFNGSERPGAVFLAAASAACNQKGLPTFKIYGRDVQDRTDNSIPEDVEEKILRFARAALVIGTIKGKSYLSMGSVAMGIAASIVDENFFQEYLGMRNEYVDMSEFTRRILENIFDREEYKKALEWTKLNCKECQDPNPPEKQESREKKDGNWETVVKMALIAKDLMVGNPKLVDIGYIEESEGHNAIASGFQGQRQWTDHFPNADFMEAMLNSSFDWNGIREPFIVSTENDCLNAATMLFGHLLNNSAQIFADVRTYWSAKAVKRITGVELEGTGADGFIYLTNSGAAALDGTGLAEKDGKPVMKPFWEITEEEKDKCIKATTWGSGKLTTFRGGGFSSNFLTKGGMPLTATRLNIIKGIGPVLQIAEGYSIDLPEDVYQTITQRTDPTWPKTFFVPNITGQGAFKDVYTVMNKWGSNHLSLCYGHVGADFITLASMLRIPVAMHNVPEDMLFRPSAWDAFGTTDLEGADFRACSTFGPLYD